MFDDVGAPPPEWFQLTKAERREVRRKYMAAMGHDSPDGVHFKKRGVHVQARVTSRGTTVTATAPNARIAAGAIAQAARRIDAVGDSLRAVASDKSRRYGSPRTQISKTPGHHLSMLRGLIQHELMTADFRAVAKRLPAIAKRAKVPLDEAQRELADFERKQPDFGARERRLRGLASAHAGRRS